MVNFSKFSIIINKCYNYNIYKKEFLTMTNKKYENLYLFFTNQDVDKITLSFKEIEEINKKKLPNSAYKYKAYWGNHINNSISKSWMLAYYKVTSVNFINGEVSFAKSSYNKKNKEVEVKVNRDISKENNNPIDNKIIEEIKDIIIQTSI